MCGSVTVALSVGGSWVETVAPTWMNQPKRPAEPSARRFSIDK